MGLESLLQAAEFIERREREAEHGYASTAPSPYHYKSMVNKRPKLKTSQGSRTTHNELEKNRRAHLRCCLEKLKQLVPLGTDSSRHTTLGLLNKARKFIKSLEDRDRRHLGHKETLSRHNRYLRRRLESLSSYQQAMYKRRSVSESSSSALSTASSSSSTFYSLSTNSSASPSRSESDEVDVIGYSSNQSDTDDHSSIQSSSDSGVALSTSRLSLHNFSI